MNSRIRKAIALGSPIITKTKTESRDREAEKYWKDHDRLGTPAPQFELSKQAQYEKDDPERFGPFTVYEPPKVYT